jgi:hypothetical protein
MYYFKLSFVIGSSLYHLFSAIPTHINSHLQVQHSLLSTKKLVKFEVFMAVKNQVKAFCVVMPCSITVGYQ